MSIVMSRFVQQRSSRGSQRWIQELVNDHPIILEDAIGMGRIEWISPLASDGYAEYRDNAFLDCIEIKPLKRSLLSFWPPRGPQQFWLNAKRISAKSSRRQAEPANPAPG